MYWFFQSSDEKCEINFSSEKRPEISENDDKELHSFRICDSFFEL